MTDSKQIADYCDSLLNAAGFDDYCPNGLQVEGDRPVRRLLSGVTASQALVDAAVAEDVDALLVHHGYFWRGEDARLVGMKGRRVRTLMRAGISLLAYHLPLDAHPDLGNNRRLATVLGLCDPVSTEAGKGLVWRGDLPEPMTGAAFAEHIRVALGGAPVHIQVLKRPLRSLAWCSGGAQGFLPAVAELGVDAYLSGEISEQTTHEARELGLDFFAAGHHRTERYGVWALGDHIAERFGVEHSFQDLDNPA